MRQLHASDSHGVERRREVVVRPDGSKVIRVEKRRRTYSDDQREPNRAMLKNKRFLIGLCILVLLVAGATGGIKPAHIRLGALLEMVHLASLVHDDVIDEADKRRPPGAEK